MYLVKEGTEGTVTVKCGVVPMVTTTELPTSVKSMSSTPTDLSTETPELSSILQSDLSPTQMLISSSPGMSQTTTLSSSNMDQKGNDQGGAETAEQRGSAGMLSINNLKY